MPKSVFGIPGMNPWNLLLVNVVAGFFLDRSKQRKPVPLPGGIRFLILFYFFVILLSFIRAGADIRGITEFYEYLGYKPPGFKTFVLDGLLNPIKYSIPGLLAYYGTNGAKRLKMLLIAILAANFLIALQIIQIMPISSMTGGEAMQKRAIVKIDNRLGYYRSDAAIFLAGAAWGVFAMQDLWSKRYIKLACLGGLAIIALSIGLTGGRAGQGAFLVIGAILAVLRWRRLIMLAPVGLMVLVIVVPSVLDRFTQGFTYDPEDSHFKHADSVEEGQMKSVTSGRSTIWPYVMDAIKEAPITGYGRKAMQRIGISLRLAAELNEVFPHPHNAYLQIILDNGILLALPILIFYFIACGRAFMLFRRGEGVLGIVTGAICFAFLFSFLLGAVAQQSFYPPSSSVIILCAMGITFRLHAEKYYFKRVKSFENDDEQEWGPEYKNARKQKR